ncbi:MAG: Asp-tRNA(Asn)/Glu-tRNA(Gln) amidotransferase subunit GatA [Candidatus Coatesbacteria bacterium]
MKSPASLTIHEAAAALRAKTLSSVELTKAVFERIRAVEPQVHAYLHLTEEDALAQAAASDRRRAAEESRGPLDGVPIALKDNLCTRGVPTTCASKILERFVPPYDATVVTRLRAAGAVITGKTNLDEFAFGSSTENSAFGPSRNPWDLDRVPGGSSGGSAAAVAADEAIAALGSDTGGSIRQPAALCGLAGLKPTYGRVSRYGLIAFASSLDQIGPLAKDVEDCAILEEAIEGWDAADSTSVRLEGPSVTQASAGDIQGLRIGIAKEWLGTGLDPEVRAAVDGARVPLEKLGCTFREISLPLQDYALPIYYLVAPAEASSNLARFDGVKYGRREDGANIVEMYKKSRSAGFGPETKRRIILGTYVLSAGYYDAYYLKALKARTRLRQDYLDALKECDALLSPATPTPAFRIGEKADDPLQMYLSDIYTVSVNLVGLPALVVPCGFSAAGLPIGMQLIGRAFDDATLLRVGARYQNVTDWHRRKPPLPDSGEGGV